MEDDRRMGNSIRKEEEEKRGGRKNRIGESNRAAESGTKIVRYKQAEKKEENEEEWDDHQTNRERKSGKC